MAQLFDTDPTSNEFFFITGLDGDFLGAGKNSLVVHCTDRVLVDKSIVVTVNDRVGNPVALSRLQPYNIKEVEPVTTRTYIATIDDSVVGGIGSVKITGTAIDLVDYTGSYAFYRGKAYPVNEDERLPLQKIPVGATAFPEASLTWSRKIFISTEEKSTSKILFFDRPQIKVKPQIYTFPQYPTSSYALATGSCSGISLVPKNNDKQSFDYTTDEPKYQVFRENGTKFVSTMEGEYVRIKSPYVNKFTYSNYSNNQVEYSGVLNTDFVVKVVEVVNENSLLIEIPFATVSDLIGRLNSDSPYNANNLVNSRGYDISDEASKQSVYLKKNFYSLSISYADYEILYIDAPKTLPRMELVSGSLVRKSLVEIEFNNLRTYSGHTSYYRVYGRSLNSPESKTLMVQGKVEPDEHIQSNNFDNGLFNHAGKFYSQEYLSRFWITSSAALTFTQSSAVFADGVYVGHPGNSDESDYVIFKDDTTGAARTPAYLSYVLLSGSYWYANAAAFLNADAQPSASYGGIAPIPALYPYTASQENILSGELYDSNPIKLRKSTLYRLTMKAKPIVADRNNPPKLKVYYVSGQFKKLIGAVEYPSENLVDGLYSATFFSDTAKFGTIMAVPIGGFWHISNISLTPHQSDQYSIDSFKVKIPLPMVAMNELFEIEAELYDSVNRLAYGAGGYATKQDKTYHPLSSKFFVNPAGIATTYGGSAGSVLILDGGDAFTIFT